MSEELDSATGMPERKEATPAQLGGDRCGGIQNGFLRHAGRSELTDARLKGEQLGRHPYPQAPI